MAEGMKTGTWILLILVFLLSVSGTIYYVAERQKPVQVIVLDNGKSDSLQTALKKVDSLQIIIDLQAERIVLQKRLLSLRKKQQAVTLDSVISLKMDDQALYFASRTGLDSLESTTIPDTSYLVPSYGIRNANKLFAEGDAAKENEQLLTTLQSSQDSLIHLSSLLRSEYDSSTNMLLGENELLRKGKVIDDRLILDLEHENRALWIGGGAAAILLILSIIF